MLRLLIKLNLLTIINYKLNKKIYHIEFLYILYGIFFYLTTLLEGSYNFAKSIGDIRLVKITVIIITENI